MPKQQPTDADRLYCVLWDVVSTAASGQQHTNRSLIAFPPFNNERCMQFQAYADTQTTPGGVHSHTRQQHHHSQDGCKRSKVLLNDNFAWHGSMLNLVKTAREFYKVHGEHIQRDHQQQEARTKPKSTGRVNLQTLMDRSTQCSYILTHSKSVLTRRQVEDQPVCYYDKIKNEIGLDSVVREGDSVAIVKLVVGHMSGFPGRGQSQNRKRRQKRKKRAHRQQQTHRTRPTFHDLTYKNQLAVVSKYRCKKGDGLASITLNSPGSGSPTGLLAGLARLRTHMKGFSQFKVVKPLTLSNVCTISQSKLSLLHPVQSSLSDDSVSMAMVQFPGKEKYTQTAKSIDFSTNTNMYGKIKGQVLKQAMAERDADMKNNPACDHMLLRWKADVDERRGEMSERPVNSLLAVSRAMGASSSVVDFLTKKCTLSRLCVATSGRLSRARYDWRNKAAMRAFKAENSKKTRHLLIQCPQISMLLAQLPESNEVKSELKQSLTRISLRRC